MLHLRTLLADGDVAVQHLHAERKIISKADIHAAAKMPEVF